MRLPLLIGAFLSPLFCAKAAAQEAAEPEITVNASGEEFEDPGGYGQPQWAERSRASSTTKLYVLSPYEFFVGFFSESDFRKHGKSVHDLSQEIELGLPNRFEVGFENHLGLTGSRAAETMANIEARYALAKWGAIPLNPTISVGYDFAIKNQHDGRARKGLLNAGSDRPGAYELELLLGQEFVPRVQWALNCTFRQEIGNDRHREIGFTQDITYLIVADRLEIGAEMRYRHVTSNSRKLGSANEFIIGPSVSWKPNRHTVIDFAPLLGCTRDSAVVSAFLTISFEFGGAESRPPEGSLAAHNR